MYIYNFLVSDIVEKHGFDMAKKKMHFDNNYIICLDFSLKAKQVCIKSKHLTISEYFFFSDLPFHSGGKGHIFPFCYNSKWKQDSKCQMYFRTEFPFSQIALCLAFCHYSPSWQRKRTQRNSMFS